MMAEQPLIPVLRLEQVKEVRRLDVPRSPMRMRMQLKKRKTA
jgi:hypothetical protein